MSKRTPNPYKDHPLLGRRTKHPLTHEEKIERFLALFEQHKIEEPDALSKLAICLAYTFVPAFQLAGRAGRPLKRDHPIDEAFIVMEFERRKSEFPHKRPSEIYRDMAKTPEYKEESLTSGAIKSLIENAVRRQDNRARVLSAFQLMEISQEAGKPKEKYTKKR